MSTSDYSRRTTLSGGLTRRETLQHPANTGAVLTATGKALSGLYAALHSMVPTVTAEVHAATGTRRVTVVAEKGGPRYSVEAATRIEAALALCDDILSALRAGQPFGRLAE